MTVASSHLPKTNVSPAMPLKIAIVDHTAALGGGEIALLNFVSRLDRRKFDARVILFSDGPLRGKLAEAGVQTILFPLAGFINNTRKGSLSAKALLQIPKLFAAMWFVLRLALLFRRQKLALIHTNSLKSDILGGLAGRLARIPVIWHLRDRIDADYLPPLAVRVFRSLARVIPTYVIANSGATMATLHLADRKKNFTVYSGINLRSSLRVVYDGTPVQGEGQDRRQALDAPVIGLVGRITPWKGQHIFIQAAAQVLKAFPHARFQIIGSPLFGEHGYNQEIHQLAETLGVSPSVEFLGFRTDVTELIANLHILVHASTSGEPFGQVIVEGMAAGKPVVATNGGGVPEIVIDGQTGILVPMADAAAMAHAIVHLLNNPQLMQEMGLAGRRRVEAEFSIEHTVSKIEHVYQSLFPPSMEAA